MSRDHTATLAGHEVHLRFYVRQDWIDVGTPGTPHQQVPGLTQITAEAELGASPFAPTTFGQSDLLPLVTEFGEAKAMMRSWQVEHGARGDVRVRGEFIILSWPDALLDHLRGGADVS